MITLKEKLNTFIPLNKILYVLEKNYVKNSSVYSEKFPTLKDLISALVRKQTNGGLNG